MNFTLTEKDTINILSIQGNLISEYNNRELLDEIDFALDKKSSNFIIDLEKLENLNSSGLGVLITILTKSRKAGGDTIIINVPDNINKLLIITKLNTVFNFAEDLKSALKKLSQ